MINVFLSLLLTRGKYSVLFYVQALKFDYSKDDQLFISESKGQRWPFKVVPLHKVVVKLSFTQK